MCYSSICPLCNGANQCALTLTGESKSRCWCLQVVIAPETLSRIPKEQLNVACICPSCAGHKTKASEVTLGA